LHIKSLDSFVQLVDGRPTAAVQLDGDGGFELVNPRRELIARAKVSFGQPAAGHTVFNVGGSAVAIGVGECPRPIMIDCGPGADCFFVYAPQPGADSNRATRRRRGSTS
jgi:hypothetical protein